MTTTLSDWDESTPPPRIQRQTTVDTRQDPNVAVKAAGWVGPIPQRDTLGFVKEASRGDHWYHTFKEDRGGAYAVSTDAFRRLRQHGATRLLVVEVDTGDVYEWSVRDWLDNVVPKTYRDNAKDPQQFGVVDTARQWTDHAGEVFIDSTVALQGDYG